MEQLKLFYDGLVTSYFTFGQAHIHEYKGIRIDRNIVVKITAKDPRAKMFELFGREWGFQYHTIEDVGMEWYPRGIIVIC